MVFINLVAESRNDRRISTLMNQGPLLDCPDNQISWLKSIATTCVKLQKNFHDIVSEDTTEVTNNNQDATAAQSGCTHHEDDQKQTWQHLMQIKDDMMMNQQAQVCVCHNNPVSRFHIPKLTAVHVHVSLHWHHFREHLWRSILQHHHREHLRRRMINVYTTPTNQQQSDLVQHASTLLSLHNTLREPSTTGRVGVLAGAAAAKASHPSKGVRDYPLCQAFQGTEYCGITSSVLLYQQLQAILQATSQELLNSVSPTATVSGKAMDTIMLACVADMYERQPYSLQCYCLVGLVECKTAWGTPAGIARESGSIQVETYPKAELFENVNHCGRHTNLCRT